MFSTLRSQKGLAPITVILIAVGIVIVAGGIYWWQKSAPTPPTLTPKSTTPTTHKDYKQVLASKLAYSSNEDKSRHAQGEMAIWYYFNKDVKDNIYVQTGFGEVKIFDSGGNLKSTFRPQGDESDPVIDEKGNIYFNDIDSPLYEKSLYRHTSDGVFQTKIGIRENLPSGVAFSGMYIIDNKIYEKDADQFSYLIGRIEGDTLKKAEALKFQGVLGSTSGNWYKVNLTERFKKGEVNILDSTGNISRTVNVEIKGLVSMRVLGEDEKGNFYVQTEKTGETGPAGMKVINEAYANSVILEVHKFDSTGKLLISLVIPNADYTQPSNKLLLVGEDGAVWQVVPANDGWRINKWSNIY